MDPSEGEIALRRLAAAEEAVARARDLAERQREIVARLESARHDTTHGRQLLGMFETIRANHERRRAMLLDELMHCGWKHVEP